MTKTQKQSLWQRLHRVLRRVKAINLMKVSNPVESEDLDVPSNTPTIEELVAEGIPRDIAVLIRPFLNKWASEVGDLSRAIRAALAG